MAVDESAEGGPDRAECLTVARALYQAGRYDLLNLNGIAASTTRGISRVIGGMSIPLGTYLADVAAFRSEVGVPVIHAGRVADLSTAAHAVESGAVDLVGMTRAHMADPYIVRKLMAKQADRIRPCVGAAYCIDRIYAGRSAFCLHNPATGRETVLPQTISRSTGKRRKVVVVGGGPAGLEAARVAALRGHEVVLFEAGQKLGGQLLIASKLGWRRDLVGIIDWLQTETERLGVEFRYNTYAEADDIFAERPDLAVIATGGTPRAPAIPGGELARSSWDAAAEPGEFGSALIYDEDGSHGAISLAQHLAVQGRGVTIATNDRVLGRSLGGSSYPIYLGALAEAGARIITDHRLAAIEKQGNRLVATLSHEFGRIQQVIAADRVFAELGTEPADQLFHDLKFHARNRGVTDVNALKASTPQPWLNDGQTGLLLFRVGDAVASRDVHAAMLDSLRILKDA